VLLVIIADPNDLREQFHQLHYLILMSDLVELVARRSGRCFILISR
jgi:hypothetical protein